MRFDDVQGCPVPRPLAPFVRQLLKDTGATLESAYRGDDPNAAGILRRHGKHTQAYLFAHQHDPGFFPANRPGQSTHELRNDGVAYPRLPVGARLPWYACGLDFDNAHVAKLIVAANRRGWKVVHYYSAASEYHHLNFDKPPLLHRAKAALRVGR